MPLKETELTASTPSGDLYLNDLVWIDERVNEFSRNVLIDFPTFRKGVTFELKGIQYSEDSLQDLIDKLDEIGINAIDNLHMHWFSFHFFFSAIDMSISLSEINEVNRGKFYQILEFLKIKESKRNKKKPLIYLFTREESKKVVIGYGESTLDELYLNSIKSISKPWSFLKSELFWVIFGVVVAIIAIVITYLLAKGII